MSKVTSKTGLKTPTVVKLSNIAGGSYEIQPSTLVQAVTQLARAILHQKAEGTFSGKVLVKTKLYSCELLQHAIVSLRIPLTARLLPAQIESIRKMYPSKNFNISSDDVFSRKTISNAFAEIRKSEPGLIQSSAPTLDEALNWEA